MLVALTLPDSWTNEPVLRHVLQAGGHFPTGIMGGKQTILQIIIELIKKGDKYLITVSCGTGVHNDKLSTNVLIT